MKPGITQSRYRSGGNFTERLRRQRIEVALPVLIQGTTREGFFEEATQSVSVNAYGCIVPLSAPVVVAQQISVVNPGTGKKAAGMVTFVGLKNAEKSVVSIEFFEPSVSFWGIAIPGWNHSNYQRHTHGHQGQM
ncbi:MAG: hypothetical protein ABSA57_21000 [Candidatus Acidiferrales bacterium]|jgi:hypothetical protein